MTKKHIGNDGYHDEDIKNIGVTYHSDGNTLPCHICNNNGECDNTDIFECHNYYLKLNPSRNEEIEIWDVEKKIWIKRRT